MVAVLFVVVEPLLMMMGKGEGGNLQKTKLPQERGKLNLLT